VNLINNIWVVTVSGSPGQGASQVEKSPRLNWATQYLTVAYGGACSLLFPSEWREFSSAPRLAGKKILMIARVYMLLKSRASPDMLLFRLCKKKRLAIRRMKRLLFPTTLSVPSYYTGK